MQIPSKSFFSAALGTMIEYYDYALLTIFLPILAPLFFPADSIYHSLMKAYWIVLITMLMRPLGGIFFGYWGDTAGRRKALLMSIYGIAFSTFFIAILPSYEILGVWASILIITAKSIQMFCFGGEYNGAGIYVVELSQGRHEALSGSLLTAIMLTGSLAASLIGIGFTYPSMPAWSWRIAFILGSLAGMIGIWRRQNLSESPQFQPADRHSQSLTYLLKKYPAELIAGIFIGGFATLPYMTALAFINPVLMAKGYITNHQLMIQQTYLLLIAIAALVISGKLADFQSPIKIMQWGCLLLVISAYPVLRLIDQGHWVFGAMSLLIISNEMLLGPANAYLKNLFAVEYRYRASSLSFCLGMSLTGGVTPLLENFFYQRSGGHFSAITPWLVLMGICTSLSLYGAEKKKAQSSCINSIKLLD